MDATTDVRGPRGCARLESAQPSKKAHRLLDVLLVGGEGLEPSCPVHWFVAPLSKIPVNQAKFTTLARYPLRSRSITKSPFMGNLWAQAGLGARDLAARENRSPVRG